MLRRSPFLLCTMLVLAGGLFEANGLDRNQSSTVPFDLYSDYLIVLQTTVGPLKGLNFLLDTGANPSVITPRVAARLHLQTSPTQIAVLNGTASAANTIVPVLRVGPVHKDNLPALVEDLGFLAKTVPVQVDGIVGLDVLGESAFVIDYASRRILFGAPVALSNSAPLQLRRGLPIVSATINEQPVQLLLDTGAPSLILFRNAAAIPGPDGPVASKSIGDYDHKEIRLRSVAFGHTTFTGEPAFIVPSCNDASRTFDGLMSPAALGIVRIVVDLPNRAVTFSRDR